MPNPNSDPDPNPNPNPYLNLNPNPNPNPNPNQVSTHAEWPAALATLVRECCAISPEARPTIKEVLRRLDGEGGAV